MQRGTFLKLAATTAFATGARLAFPWAAAASTTPVSFGGLLWRAAGAGKIQTSADAGRTWKLHSDLGSTNSITKLTVRNYRLHATVSYSGYSFPLVLARDKRSWRTV
ncbi:MAG: hypothetical protein QOG85_1563 [Gaiellaceae bacterium]|jgi:hypothetical protein|nr:hypothetical protein [Gaiellaceae bacterium]